MLGKWAKYFKNKTQEKEPLSRVDPYESKNLDSLFAKHFTQNGGFFNYASNSEEAVETLGKVLEKLNPECIFCRSQELQNLLVTHQYKYQNKLDANCDLAFIDCECLVAFDGSIMVSYDNIKNYKLQSLPHNIIVLGKTNQLVPNKSRGLEYIRRKKKDHIPSNITSLNAKKSQDYLKPDLIKDLYLLLLESNH